jgi:hypothetical protein
MWRMVGLRIINILKFVVHNMILRKRAIENSNFIVNQKLGDAHISVSDIKKKLIRKQTWKCHGEKVRCDKF